MQETHIYLIRHGAYDDLVDGRYVENPALSNEGVQQARRLYEYLSAKGSIQADRLFSSTMRRAQETAEILAPLWHIPVTSESKLAEWHSDDGTISPEDFHGRWQGLTEWQKPFYRFVPGCETWLEFCTRIQQVLDAITQEHIGKTIVIVTHGEVIQASFNYFFRISPTILPGVSLETSSVTHWQQSGNSQRWILKSYNEHRHLL